MCNFMCLYIYIPLLCMLQKAHTFFSTLSDPSHPKGFYGTGLSSYYGTVAWDLNINHATKGWMGSRFQQSAIKPFLSKTLWHLFAMDPTSLAEPGYSPTASKIFGWNSSKVSLGNSKTRSFFSAQPQTFSWGLRSGEYFGQLGNTEMLHSVIAFLATAV